MTKAHAPFRRRAGRVVVDDVAMERTVAARDLPVVPVEGRLSAAESARFLTRSTHLYDSGKKRPSRRFQRALGERSSGRPSKRASSGVCPLSRRQSELESVHLPAKNPTAERTAFMADSRCPRLLPSPDFGPRALIEPLASQRALRRSSTHIVDLHHHLHALLRRAFALADECVVELVTISHGPAARGRTC